MTWCWAATHWEEMGGAPADLPGPTPAFFFAPSQIAKRSADWGQDVLDQKLGESWDRYAAWAGQWVEFRHAAGPDAVAETYLRLLDNQADPTVGHIVSMTPSD